MIGIGDDMETDKQDRINEDVDSSSNYLQIFRLYETHSNFYIIGRDKSRTSWRVLKIGRSEPSEVNILEDPMTYAEHQCNELLKRIDEENVQTGGLKFVTTCYGIIGFIKFLGPHYMLIITKRRKIGAICGRAIYSIAKSEMIPISHSHVQSNMAFTKNENRSFVYLPCKSDLSTVLLKKPMR
ncbi:hypothetical protein SAY86_032085 [Trapa natans]|uniref:SAC domain-containing protein n=1 Tax=Trapa natans TaxID=22666 RepID=A0AAN7R6N2_TRANT|nr:hypothetical protein SAY86_032085 [Trapa natans]